MFLNISNYPSAEWAPEQRAAARVLFLGAPGFQAGQISAPAIEDWPFPDISTQDKAEELAKEHFARIMNMSPRPKVVHIMGDMRFALALASRLMAAGIRCVTSVWEYYVIEKKGVKITRRSFVEFRNYMCDCGIK